ncbi:MAG TPA: cytochrome C oxidase subunit IV family protein [Vicinamibacterales bacterium]|nr:cytochrome C oxidase subunit IV family protein [Vicinamibacterales bacterium]
MSAHVLPVRLYVAVFAALMVLTAVTVAAAFVDLGFLNTFVALTIAVTKATLVALYFMHVRYSTPLVKVTVVAGLVWLGILFALGLSDYLSRGWVGGGV